MILKKIWPSDATFGAYFAALISNSAMIHFLVDIVEEAFYLKSKYFHYGVLVDAYARTQTPENILEAVNIVKSIVPIIAQEWVFVSILSRCYPSKDPTEEDILKFKRIYLVAQDLIDFLDGKGYKYVVLMSTQWRLKVRGIKWPKSVSTKHDYVPTKKKN